MSADGKLDPFGGIRSNIFALMIIRGILGVLIAVLAFCAPVLTIMILAIALGVWLIFDGIAGISMSLHQRKAEVSGWGWLLASSILGVVAGLVALFYPLATTLVWGVFLLWILAVWSFIRGLVELGNRAGGGWGIGAGILDIVFGIVLAIVTWTNATAAIEGLLWVLGIYALIFGIFQFIWAFRIRNAK
jgi:uncharacterized membrane protein HdeD (DUF308 family)